MSARRLAVEAVVFGVIFTIAMAGFFAVFDLSLHEPADTITVVDMPPACSEALDAAADVIAQDARADSARRAAVAVTDDLMPANLEGRARDVADIIKASDEHKAAELASIKKRDGASDLFEEQMALCQPEREP